MSTQGKFFVIEGSDGSGKGTQFKLLEATLKSQGKEVAVYDFPRYESGSSFFIKKYLRGEYGTSNEVSAKQASYFYALDRFDTAKAIRTDLSTGKIVIANRFTASNLAHQGQKITNFDERKAFYTWLTQLEFDELNIPRPDLNVVLLVPATIAQGLVDKKSNREYINGEKRDIHEADLEHLERAVNTYQELCSLYPEEFIAIDCVSNDTLLSVEDIQTSILTAIDQS